MTYVVMEKHSLQSLLLLIEFAVDDRSEQSINGFVLLVKLLVHAFAKIISLLLTPWIFGVRDVSRDGTGKCDRCEESDVEKIGMHIGEFWRRVLKKSVIGEGVEFGYIHS